MRWAFWRRPATGRRDEPEPQDRPLPDSVGLPAAARPRAARRAPEVADETDERDGRQRPSPFSGAAPDAAAARRAAGGATALPAGVPLEPSEGGPAARLTPPEQRLCRSAVVDAVRAALSDDARALDTALAPAEASAGRQVVATRLASRALAERLPALSGVSGPVVDEAERDLLRAYAELLAERAEPTRARVAAEVPRELLLHLAQLGAGRVLAASPDEPVSVLAGPLGPQLRALCVLLAQSARDGAPGPDALADGAGPGP